jgi:hypothetical protein
MKRNKRKLHGEDEDDTEGEKNKEREEGERMRQEDGGALHTENMAEQNTGKKNTLEKKSFYVITQNRGFQSRCSRQYEL